MESQKVEKKVGEMVWKKAGAKVLMTVWKKAGAKVEK